MKPRASSLFVSTGLLVLAFALTAGDTARAAAQLNTTIAADDVVTLVRRLEAGRPCSTALGFPADRVFPDGTKESFTVPVGKALVITDLEGEITRNPSVGWPVGAVGYLTATLTGATANQMLRARTAITADAADAGIATLNLHLQSGVIADSGAVVCLRALVTTANFSGIANVGADVRLHGYLIPR
jgi:hypothetical protein